MIRDEVLTFARHGPLPPETDNSEEGDAAFAEMERALHAIEKPVSEEEAQVLLGCFGDDNCFGLAWTLLHLIESAPVPVVVSEPPVGSNVWVVRLWTRYKNSLSD